MDEHSSQRRTVLKGSAVAALLSVTGSTTTGAQETGVDNERAAEMLREFYGGYLEGISQAVATDVRMEASSIEDGRDEPWPLEVWNDVEDARSHGVTLGASDGGSQPFWDEYTSFDREFDGSPGDGGIEIELLGTNDPVPAGEILEVTAELENTTGSEVSADVDFVVGHDPQTVDTANPTLAGGTSETVTLAFETVSVSSDQEFPVRVEGADDTAETSVEVTGTNDTA